MGGGVGVPFGIGEKKRGSDLLLASPSCWNRQVFLSGLVTNTGRDLERIICCLRASVS